ncbi:MULTISPECIES: phosphotransferase family protein [Nocardiopsidaceae]|uniref:Aminoglycoside phosphotransferase family protein n=2 Tax=Nocardiopsidaceae TaxID=83676 RepID=A0ABY6YNS1_9ACTN|nr:aminoglycoside phosphotransferase family protein [Streptomonospora nanhaiensis]WAE74042.1 aminoglycoside phosphotransferase family protein [Streptomonospora nanhaiensis]
MQQHDEAWVRFFEAKGYPEAAELAAGMEGAVYALNDDLVAKVWGVRSGEELERLQRFYDDLAKAQLAFRTPRIEEVLYENGRFVSIEQRLSGVPLADMDPRRPELWPQAAACMLDVLGEISTADSPALRGLAVLDEASPFWEGHTSWPDALTALIHRRLALFGDQLRAAVPGFDGKLARILELVGDLGDVPLGLMHGDLVPDNVLVNDECQVVGTLDFGFLSTVGDPVFDAALTASIFDMYGPQAHETEAYLDAAVVERFGCPPERMALYRAVYGIIASNAYDPQGQDGHFKFCADLLLREDVSELLGGVSGPASRTGE